MKANFLGHLISTVIFLSLSNFSLGSEKATQCTIDTNDAEAITSLNNKYLEFSSLYTGGMHFKQLGSADGSVTIYLALNNQFDTIRKIDEANLIKGNGLSADVDLYQTPIYLRRFSTGGWSGEEKPYEITPAEALQSALKVTLTVKPAYKHISDLELPYQFHYRQAGFDLDVFTALAEPVDWWLATEKPVDISDIKIATWESSKTNDLTDWLQFVATTSALPHLQNWNFSNLPQRQEGYLHLKKHAHQNWMKTKSYAWLAALAETSSPNDDEAEIVLNEFDRLSKKTLNCKASTMEKVAYGMMLMNAVRLGYGKPYDIKSWLTPSKNDLYKNIKFETVNRLNQYILATESFEGYRIFWEKIGPNVISENPKVTAITAKKAEDFIFPSNSVARNFDEVELRLLSILSIKDIIRLADQSNLLEDSKRKLIRTAFLRSWVKNDTGDDGILHKLALIEPSLATLISEIIDQKNNHIKKATLLKLVMENPAMTYLLGVQLYMSTDIQPINEFVQYNSEDGSWWCETLPDKIVDKYVESTIKPFGLTGHNPQTSGGSWGADFYNPGQKRAYLRNEKIITDPILHKEISEKLKKNHILLNYSENEEWIKFSKLPPAPTFFANKVYELEKTKKIKDEDMIELYKLLIRAAKKTCKNQEGVYETFKNAKTNLQLHYGVTLN